LSNPLLLALHLRAGHGVGFLLQTSMAISTTSGRLPQQPALMGFTNLLSQFLLSRLTSFVPLVSPSHLE
jgi:hypothetical protein